MLISACPLCSSSFSTWWEFRPRKKIFTLQFPASTLPAPPPPRPHPPRRTPPLLGFSKKIAPPAYRRLGLPLPRPRAEKKNSKISETSTKSICQPLQEPCVSKQRLADGVWRILQGSVSRHGGLTPQRAPKLNLSSGHPPNSTEAQKELK